MLRWFQLFSQIRTFCGTLFFTWLRQCRGCDIQIMKYVGDEGISGWLLKFGQSIHNETNPDWITTGNADGRFEFLPPLRIWKSRYVKEKSTLLAICHSFVGYWQKKPQKNCPLRAALMRYVKSRIECQANNMRGWNECARWDMNGVVENKGGKRKHGPRRGTVNHSELNIMDVQMN